MLKYYNFSIHNTEPGNIYWSIHELDSVHKYTASKTIIKCKVLFSVPCKHGVNFGIDYLKKLELELINLELKFPTKKLIHKLIY